MSLKQALQRAQIRKITSGFIWCESDKRRDSILQGSLTSRQQSQVDAEKPSLFKIRKNFASQFDASVPMAVAARNAILLIFDGDKFIWQ